MPDAGPLASRSLAALRETFGHAAFRDAQAEIVSHVAGGGRFAGA